MEFTVIKTEKQYNEYARVFDRLVLKGQRLNAEDKEKKDLLALLIADWEKKQRYAEFTDIDPVDVLVFFMDQRGMTPEDMVRILGSRSKVSEVLNRKRPLSLSMIRNACKEFNIPASLLIDKYLLAV